MIHKRLFLGGLFLTSLMAYAKENQYVLVAAPRPLDLRPPVNRATRRDVWFDYDNAILQQRYVLDLIGATTGRCKGAAADVPDELPLHVCAVARNADTTATPA